MPLQFDAKSSEAETRVQDADTVVQRLLSFRRPYETRWSELYRHLLSKPSKIRTYPDGTDRSNVFAQFAFANVNFVRNTVNEALFGVDPLMETLPVGAKDGEAAPKMQIVLEKLAVRDANLRQVFNDFLGGLATYGFYALDVGWDWDVDFVYDWEDQTFSPDASTPFQLIGRDPQTGEPLVLDPTTGVPQIRRIQVLKPVPRNRPKFTALDIFDVAIDPDGAYVAKFFDKTVPQMERENANALASGMELYNEGALEQLRQSVFSEGDSESTRNATVHLCELWNACDGSFTTFSTSEDITALSFKDKRYAHRAAIYQQYRRPIARAAPKLLLATGQNPYAHCKVPVLFSQYTKLPGETYGMGVIEPNFDMTEKYSAALSMILDIWNFGANQRFLYNALGDIETEDLQNANVPGGFVATYGDPGGAFQEIPTHAPDPASYMILPIFQQLIERAANISDPYQRGIGGMSGNRTATGINSVIQQANKGMTNIVLQICENILQPLFMLTASNIQQFLTDEIEVRITDEAPAIPKVTSQFMRISKADLAGNFDFRVIGAAYMENRFVVQNNARTLSQAVMNVAPQYVKIGPMLRELFRLHRIPYPSRFIKTDEEVQYEQKFQEAMMLQMQALGLGQPGQPGQPGPPRPMPATPVRPQQTTDELTGATRSFAQQSGANAMGRGLPQ